MMTQVQNLNFFKKTLNFFEKKWKGSSSLWIYSNKKANSSILLDFIDFIA